MSRVHTWPTSAARLSALCLMCAVSAPTPARAQQSTGASPELIDAILRHTFRFEGGNVRIFNGRAPDDLGPNFYVPPGSRVLGSVVMGSAVRVFATTSIPPDSVGPMYTRALEPAGWKPLTWRRHGGFVDSRRDMPLMFCREGAQLHIQRHRGSAGSNDLVLEYRDGMGPCEQSAGPVFARMSEPEFPTVYNPDDSSGSARARCFPRSGRSGMGTSTWIPASMTASELLRHYARQLEAAGWRPSTSAGREVAVGSWTLADSSGVKELRLQLTETGNAGARCYDVQMRMSELTR
jgi:hypothetical protein